MSLSILTRCSGGQVVHVTSLTNELVVFSLESIDVAIEGERPWGERLWGVITNCVFPLPLLSSSPALQYRVSSLQQREVVLVSQVGELETK